MKVASKILLLMSILLLVATMIITQNQNDTTKTQGDICKEIECSESKIDKPPETTVPEYFNDSHDTNIHEDLRHLYYGRLYIPDLDISVALYYSYEQYITDRVDSANIYVYGECLGYTIGDHNNQEFSKLFGVKVGTVGYIKTKQLDVIEIECTDIFSGYNTGSYIVDKNGNIAMGLDDYLMYTCDGNGGVFICLWDMGDIHFKLPRVQ